jgi:hypothetical protein
MALNVHIYEAPIELINSWWVVLEHAGFMVTLEAVPSNASVASDSSEVHYRGGHVRENDTSVFVRPYPGPSEHARKSPLVGKHVLTIQFKRAVFARDRRHEEELAEHIGAILSTVGAKRVSPPGS